MNDWKSKTCDGCRFRDVSVCRRFPHTKTIGEYVFDHDIMKDIINVHMEYEKACAEYQPEEESQCP